MNQVEPRNTDSARSEVYATAVDDAGHPFTGKGMEAFLTAADDFVVTLAEESARTTGRRRGDAIDASDVETAATYLYSGTRRRIGNHLGTIGGILLGIAGSGFISSFQNEVPDQDLIVGSAVLTLIGAAMVAWNTASDLTRG